ncbi:DUF4129 domain-containing transglutaminase family protein [Bacillus sp. FSL K6-3431]|uniref:DUF4129 domain-containing transglutaminase family protein n=1 Tax=Bacillus sp. FSL K6-3431 TaxID=2921500 RepID=UPI0030F86BB7
MSSERNVYTFILYLFGFFILAEWVRPLSEITQTGGLHYFLLFIAFSALLNYLQLRWWLSIPLKTAIILIFLYRIFFMRMPSEFPWMQVLLSDVIDNMKSIASGHWYDLSDLSRSLLFFILLWLMTYLLQYWLTIRKSIFVFYVMTVIYIAVLDTFTVYIGKWSMIRIVTCGFALLGLLYFQRLLEKEQIETKQMKIAKWAFPLAIMIGVSVCIGYIVPKADPKWPDPVPFIQSTAENVRSESSVSKIGYGADDTQLGGPFVGDSTVVFEVETPAKQYWKVEVKDVYTGKGWITSDTSDPPIPIESGSVFAMDPTSLADKPISEAIFEMNIPYSHIIRPYGFFSVEGNEQGYFEYDSSLDKINSFTMENELIPLEAYAVQYKKAAYSMKEMRATKMLPNEVYFDMMKKQYTQLPETLPDRVRELAKEITANENNWYDQAKAIERYFQSGKFSYDQNDVAVPIGDQDYVDQFLFETFRGYCDNFSTSMVTMLRAVGIPARWAKGYSGGNYKGSAESHNILYEVTNNEAHSWVEVLFPTEGWVPFEPTIGFDNFATYVQDEEKADAAPAPPKEEKDKPEAPKTNAKDTEKKEQKEYRNSISIWPKVQSFIAKNWLVFVVLLVVIVSGCIWMIWKRSKWIPYVLIRIYKKKNEKDIFAHAYNDLLRQLERYGLKREPGQTLREYAIYIDGYFDINDMIILTEYYERTVYRGDSMVDEWEQLQKLWENVIRKTTDRPK